MQTDVLKSCRFKNNRSRAFTRWNKEGAGIKLLKTQVPGKESEENYCEQREETL